MQQLVKGGFHLAGVHYDCQVFGRIESAHLATVGGVADNLGKRLGPLEQIQEDDQNLPQLSGVIIVVSVLKELATEIGLELINSAVQSENACKYLLEISSVEESFLRVVDKVSFVEQAGLDVGLELAHLRV